MEPVERTTSGGNGLLLRAGDGCSDTNRFLSANSGRTHGPLRVQALVHDGRPLTAPAARRGGLPRLARSFVTPPSVCGNSPGSDNTCDIAGGNPCRGCRPQASWAARAKRTYRIPSANEMESWCAGGRDQQRIDTGRPWSTMILVARAGSDVRNQVERRTS